MINRFQSLNNYNATIEELKIVSNHFESDGVSISNADVSRATISKSTSRPSKDVIEADRQGISDSENGPDKSASTHSSQTVNVLHFPAFNDDGIEMRMELDGLFGSKGINFVRDANASMLLPNLVWVGSPIPRRLCNMRTVRPAVAFYQAHNPGKQMKDDWTFHLFDWSDQPDGLLRCTVLEKFVGAEKINYWKRSIVTGRLWNATTRSVELGNVSTEFYGRKVRPLHLSTRTDIVEGIASTVCTLTGRNMTPKEISEYIVTKERPGDVIHHWPTRGWKVNRGSAKHRNDVLRTETSLTLKNMTLPPYNLSRVFCGIQGTSSDQGRSSTSSRFIDSILYYKIMVVAQRDVFEGHLRLFEGLVSGAMVLHDRIIAPPVGLEENVNIVYFNNQEELKQKVMYYLAHPEERLRIARNGRKLGMCQSRTWHRMEQIILGRTVTPCDE